MSGRAKVSGSPPWEPAAKPDSELPWAAVPAPPASNPSWAPPQPPMPSAGSLWDAAAISGRAAPPSPARRPGAADAGPAPDTAAGGSAAAADPADDPMSIWNQAETTETFPAIGADDED